MTDISMYRGDTRTITETIQPLAADGTQVLGASGITGWSFWLTVKKDPGDADASAVFQKVPGSWTTNNPGNATTAGVVTCTINPADTASLPGYRSVLQFDVQAKDGSGNVFTIDRGTLTVDADVTVTTV